MKDFGSLKNIHKDKDIYVVSGGPSLNHIDKSFFDNKIVLGVNDIFRYFECDYVVVKDCNEEPRFTRLVEELKEKDIPLIYSQYYKGYEDKGVNNCNNPNSYMFTHNPRKKDFDMELMELDIDEEIIVSRSTVTTAVHIAYYMGAKNIILCGHDGGEIDGKMYYHEYVEKDWTSASNWDGIKGFLNNMERETIALKQLLNFHEVNICSLNPFINLRLEGTKFETYKI
jgi:hypothetical protein|tara:strand:+ start:3435 stop:4115 length:681 start_codon:yes stop_codon:yes gene_type:complete